MATILLSAAGAAIGSGFGGSVLGLSGAVIGRAIGATAGRAIDQRILGGGADPVEMGKVERFRVSGASEGAAVARVWGRVRLGGQVIWASRFLESASTSGSGKGTAPGSTTAYSYSVSLALALCEGQARSLGRIWADGIELSRTSLNIRFYPGSEIQLPDPKIEAVEGAGLAPGFRGIAYVVIEDLDLGRFGNRVPQFSFEIVRPAQGSLATPFADPATTLRAVALIPGTGEYALATTPVTFEDAPGVIRNVNTSTLAGVTDMALSIDQLGEELPLVEQVSMVVSWFGSDLRCGLCPVQPKVEQATSDSAEMPWTVSGLTRSAAMAVPLLSGAPVYGGSPSDASVAECITALRDAGKTVMFYPFILMDQLEGNTLTNPYDGSGSQPVLPWRGRITTSLAPGLLGTPDRTASAATEVTAFFGSAQPNQFAVSGTNVSYTGPNNWGYRRFILHYAHLCAAAGGVDAFCIGSELRGLTQIRGASNSFPAVDALCTLAADVRAILGPVAKITYAADWSEYFGYQTGNNVYFHLDMLWAHPAINCIGIDNYMPLSDWRDGEFHADAAFGSIYNIDYLKANIAGGEGYDWYYDGPEGVEAQVRKPIVDGAHGEHWIYRYKDLRNWWQNQHFQRLNGVRQSVATDWVPQSKPFWFTEFGCAAIDKGSNQPNLFLDVKSSESALPRASNGHRDDLMQAQYLRATMDYWAEAANNPTSTQYAGRMLDIARLYAWAWDARPYPAFPANRALWNDGVNYSRGHWLNGRASNQLTSAVIAEICEKSGVEGVDLDQAHGIVRGYSISNLATSRSDLQPLTLTAGIDGFEREGALVFRGRSAWGASPVAEDSVALNGDMDGAIEFTRQSSAETTGRLRLGFVQVDGDFASRTVEVSFPDETSDVTSVNELPLTLTSAEAKSISERWLSEARAARDTLRLALPPSRLPLGVGDVMSVNGQSYRIDGLEASDMLLLSATRIHQGLYSPGDEIDDPPFYSAVSSPTAVFPVFMDLPLLTGDELPHAPHFAAVSSPWLGSVAIWSSDSDAGYTVTDLAERGATFGLTESVLARERAGLWERGAPLRVKLSSGSLASAAQNAVLSGANTLVIGDGTPANWEVFQFRDATLVAPKTYDLTMRLRGQAGSNGIMPATWPSGSHVVLIDSSVLQLDLASSTRGVSRHYRTGLATLGYSDSRTSHLELAFTGIGYRPYSVAHLTASGQIGSPVTLGWIRRTRIDGDPWTESEVPLGEDRERYLVRVKQGTVVLREVEVTSPGWTYTSGDQSADGAVSPVTISVAQLSDRVGAGPFVSVSV
jgi:hypothetical protein